MSLAPPTPVSLILRIRDAEDERAWADFVELYTPLILGYSRHQGMEQADAADLTQNVLLKVCKSVHSFHPQEPGSFGGWLLKVTRNAIAEWARSLPPDRGSGRTTIHDLLKQHAEPSDDEVWEHAHQARLLEWGSQKVRTHFEEKTWQAFESTAINNEPVSDVAKRLNISVGMVYVAKSRVLARIREYIDRGNG